MAFVRRDHDDTILVITMTRPKANALNAGLVQSLRESFAIARGEDDIRGVVLTSGCRGFFSVGLDLKEVDGYDRDTMRAFWSEFRSLYEEIHEFPKPVVAALPGHTVAGGIILALACDLRLMARGDYALAVSGINMGLSLGGQIYAMAVQAVGHAYARELFLTGESIDVDRAQQMGLVRDVLPENDLLGHATQRARELAGKSAHAYAEIKAMARDAAGYNRAPAPDAEAFLDRWYSNEARAIRATALEALMAPR